MGSGGIFHKFWCDKCQCYVDFSDFETCESICEYCKAGENKTRDEALSKVVVIEHKRVVTKGKSKGQEEITGQSYRVGESIFDWFEIIDLREWMER